MEVEHRESIQAGGALQRGGAVERLVFGTRSGEVIDDLVSVFCRAQLGSPVAEVLFRATSVGVVFGLRLGDGRRIVLKAHQPREPRERLEAVHLVQGVLFRAGFPCPEPLVGPVGIGDGLAAVESLIDAGGFRDTHDPACRRLIAESLAWHLELTRACGCPETLSGAWSMYATDTLWPPEAHAPIFDFDVTSA